MAFKQCMDHLTEENVKLESLVTDRHSSIAKHMREHKEDVKHYFDLWHLRKSKFQNLHYGNSYLIYVHCRSAGYRTWWDTIV